MIVDALLAGVAVLARPPRTPLTPSKTITASVTYSKDLRILFIAFFLRR